MKITNYERRITKLRAGLRAVLLVFLLTGCVARTGNRQADQAPLRRVVCMSASHVGFIDALGCADRIVGISGVRYVSSPNVQGAVEVGYEANLNYELIVRLKPDAVFVYSVAGERLPAIDKLEELGIRIIPISEHLESTPLDKARWIVELGELLGRRERAEAIFDSVCREYEAAQKLVANIEHRPRVMFNAPWRDTWFVPGDDSYMVRLLEDAGAQHVCGGTAGVQSRAIDAEMAWVALSKADFWLHPNDATSLAQLDRRLAQGRRVYNNNLRSTAGGGSDYWESGVVYPDRVLRDLIHIFHPELLPDHTLYYYRLLN